MRIDSLPDSPELSAFIAGYLAGSHCQPSWSEATRQRGLGSITAQVILACAKSCWIEWLEKGQPGPEGGATMWERMHE